MKESNVEILDNTKQAENEFAKSGWGQDEIILDKEDIEALEKRKGIRIF